MEATEAIPEDEVLADMDRHELRSLAGSLDIPAGSEKTEREMRRILTRMREGATMLACPNLDCLHEWAYTGSAEYRTSCPNCSSTVRLGTNKIETKVDR